MSIIMVALSHYCCRTTLQCHCHIISCDGASVAPADGQIRLQPITSSVKCVGVNVRQILSLTLTEGHDWSLGLSHAVVTALLVATRRRAVRPWADCFDRDDDRPMMTPRQKTVCRRDTDSIWFVLAVTRHNALSFSIGYYIQPQHMAPRE